MLVASGGGEPAGASNFLLGKSRTELRQFEMDKVCGPESTQAQVSTSHVMSHGMSHGMSHVMSHIRPRQGDHDAKKYGTRCD